MNGSSINLNYCMEDEVDNILSRVFPGDDYCNNDDPWIKHGIIYPITYYDTVMAEEAEKPPYVRLTRKIENKLSGFAVKLLAYVSSVIDNRDTQLPTFKTSEQPTSSDTDISVHGQTNTIKVGRAAILNSQEQVTEGRAPLDLQAGIPLKVENRLPTHNPVDIPDSS